MGRDSLSLTARPEVFHIHRLTITAPAITSLFRRTIQTGEHHTAVFHIAQTSTRDSLLLTARPEVFHTHRSDITAPAITNLPIKNSMERTSTKLELILPVFSIAQTSMRDSCSPMVRPELCHTHKLATTVQQNMPSSRRRTPKSE